MNARCAAAWLALALLACALVACVRANAQEPETSTSSDMLDGGYGLVDDRDPRGASADPTSAGAASPSATRFLSYDVMLDSGAYPLAAWQVEIVDPTNRAMIVAVEGGQHLAFSDPPRYDPRALMHGRIVLAAFSTSDTLPEGSSRVARIHVAVESERDPELELRVQAAADHDGATIRVRAALSRS